MSLSRRSLLRGTGAVAASWLGSWPLRAWTDTAPQNVADAGARSVRDHGARGDGRANDTTAIQAAIDAAAPGGVVVLPPGEYLSGTLHLRDRLTLRLAAGATLIASPNDRDFDPREKLAYEPFADAETADFRHALLQGRGLEHVTIGGPGRIDGNRRSRGGPKPIALEGCRHVSIRDVTIANAPNYNISLLGCEHVDIEAVTIRNGYADGIDPDCCRHVRIARCRVESRDDAIVVKSSLALGVRHPTEHVLVTDCTLVNVRNGLKIGTESCGDFRDIEFRNCTLKGRADLWSAVDVKPFPSAGVSLQCVDGGRLEDVRVTGLTMVDMRAPIFVRLGARGSGQAAPAAGTLTNVAIADISATGAAWTSSITGIPGHDVSNVALSDIRISSKGGGAATLVSRPVPERERDYPDAARFRKLPAHGLYCRHVAGLRMERITLSVRDADARPALVLDDVREARVNNLAATPAAPGGPVAWLRSARDCVLDGIRAAPADTSATVIRLSGADTARVRIVADGGTPALALLDDDVQATALR